MSVVITCFNYAHYLSDSVTSALLQQDVPVEIIVVDDASTDDSLRVAQALATADSRVRVLANSHNTGPVHAFNAGWAAAAGEYVVRLDADDLLAPGALGRAVALMEAHETCAFVYGRPLHFTTSPPDIGRNRTRRWRIWPGAIWYARRCRMTTNAITSPEAMMRRSTLERIGGMREFRHTHDFDLWMRLSLEGDVGYLDNVVQGFHREHQASWSSAIDRVNDLRERADMFVDLSQHSSHPRLAQRALVTLAGEALGSACREYDRGLGDESVVNDFVELARMLDPDGRAVTHWRALRWRRKIGARWVKRSGWGTGAALRRRGTTWVRRLRWLRTGT